MMPREVDVTAAQCWVVTDNGLPPLVESAARWFIDDEQAALEAAAATPGARIWKAELVTTTSVSEWVDVTPDPSQ